MTRIIIPIVIICSSCTMLSRQDELFTGLNEPTELNQIDDIVLHKVNFLSAGWICAEKAGYPIFIHPLILTIFGCADVHWDTATGKVIKCHIWYSFNWALEHELKHCEGWND